MVSISILTAVVLFGHGHVVSALSSLQINTTVGPVFGLINGSTPHVAQFLGVPFAEPPIGDLRWTTPRPKSYSKISIDATRFSPSCPQYEGASPSVYSVDAREFLISGPTSEDCLTLNIWAPLRGNRKHNSTSEKFPVLIWIYGGGFGTGGGEIAYQIPSNWVERSQKHIVVGINYRVNIFGFPNAAGLDSVVPDQNLGLLDQRLGLEWVRSNIASFGGDAARITLWGQSAGAESVDYYNFAYPKDPIVAGLIMDSGSALLPNDNKDHVQSNFSFVAKSLGCGNASTKLDELKCMRKVPSANIEAFLKAYSDNGTSPSISFGPLTNNLTKFSNYTARALAGDYTRVPAIIGTNANEGTSLTTWNPNGANITNAAKTTLNEFLCPAVQSTTNRLVSNATTFRYLYAGNFSNISPRPWEGAYHSSELPLIFGTSGIARGESTDFELEVSRKMQDLWLAFISDPVNGLKGEVWGAYTGGYGSALEFGRNGVIAGRIEANALEDVCNRAMAIASAVPPV